MLTAISLQDLGLPNTFQKAEKKVMPFSVAKVYLDKDELLDKQINLIDSKLPMLRMKTEEPVVGGVVPVSLFVVEKTHTGFMGFQTDFEGRPFSVSFDANSIIRYISFEEIMEEDIPLE